MTCCDFETARLRVRPLTVSDAPEVFEWASDPVATLYVGWPRHRVLADTEAWLRAVEGKAASRPPALERSLGIALKGGGLVGSTGLQQLDHDSAATGWVLRPQAQRKGYAFEALQELLRRAFEELAWLMDLRVTIHPQNHPSQVLARRLGFKPFGQQRHPLPQMGPESVDLPQLLLRRP